MAASGWAATRWLIFDKTGARLWAEPLPEVAVGMDAIPGGQGGLMIGGHPWGGIVQHYTSDGLMVGEMSPSKDKGVAPNNPSGLLDAFLAVNTNRDPRDGILDVFVEDDYNLRIEWYRVDDHDIQTLTGTVNLPMPPKPVVSPAPPVAAKGVNSVCRGFPQPRQGGTLSGEESRIPSPKDVSLPGLSTAPALSGIKCYSCVPNPSNMSSSSSPTGVTSHQLCPDLTSAFSGTSSG